MLARHHYINSTVHILIIEVFAKFIMLVLECHPRGRNGEKERADIYGERKTSWVWNFICEGRKPMRYVKCQLQRTLAD